MTFFVFTPSMKFPPVGVGSGSHPGIERVDDVRLDPFNLLGGRDAAGLKKSGSRSLMKSGQVVGGVKSTPESWPKTPPYER
jgi:hypothetical protein